MLLGLGSGIGNGLALVITSLFKYPSSESGTATILGCVFCTTTVGVAGSFVAAIADVSTFTVLVVLAGFLVGFFFFLVWAESDKPQANITTKTRMILFF